MRLRTLLCALALVGAPLHAHAQGSPPMPPGHAGFAAHQTEQDAVEPAAELKPGSIEATILDADERPLPGTDVRVGIMFQKIAEGESHREKTTKAGPDGVAHFDGLSTGSAYSYRITVRNGPAQFETTPFNLKDAGGMKVSLHVFEAIQDLTGAAVGMRGFFYIETRDDVFQIEGLFRVINLGRTAWVPRDVLVGLPDGWKAFNAGETMFDSRWEAVDGRGARLLGTFPPGQRDMSFRFQVPKDSSTTAMFRFAPPPRSAEVRVIAVASQSMGLEVDGFEPPQDSVGPSGDRVLVTRKLAGKGNPSVGPFLVTLTGLPVPGPGRWVAIFIALGLAAAGGAASAGKWRFVSTERIETDRHRASNLVLDELVALENAKQRGEIGPQTHQRTHRALIDALARIGLPSEPKPRKGVRKAQRV